jgi:hypothetical protein
MLQKNRNPNLTQIVHCILKNKQQQNLLKEEILEEFLFQGQDVREETQRLSHRRRGIKEITHLRLLVLMANIKPGYPAPRILAFSPAAPHIPAISEHILMASELRLY